VKDYFGYKMPNLLQKAKSIIIELALQPGVPWCGWFNCVITISIPIVVVNLFPVLTDF